MIDYLDAAKIALIRNAAEEAIAVAEDHIAFLVANPHEPDCDQQQVECAQMRTRAEVLLALLG